MRSSQDIVCEVAQGNKCVRLLKVINTTLENMQTAKHKSVRLAERTPCIITD